MSETQRPNILWICSDQQRFDTLGCYGNPFVHSPNIDRLAAQGMLFEQVYSQSPVCTPSRAAFLTGRYPRTTRDRQNGQNMPADEVLITRVLADEGYTCGLSGKLHISVCHPKTLKDDLEPRINDGYTDFHWSHHPRPDWPKNEYGIWLKEKGLEWSTPNLPDCKYVQVGPPAEAHQTTWCAEKAEDFIRANAGTGQPWLFSVNMFDPHHPFDPPAEYLQPYLEKLDEIPLPNYIPGELEDKPLSQQNDHLGAYNRKGMYAYPDMTERDHRLVRAAYWAMCDLIDDQVGRLMRVLEETGQLENTVVIFMSDHGEMLGDHGFYLKGPYFYDCSVHVPLIVYWKGHIEGGRRATGRVELFDIAPSILDLAGLAPLPGMQAHSLYPILTGEASLDTAREDVYSEYYNAMPWECIKAFATMVRTEDWKLVAFHGRDEGELYDLKNDPGENRNLWNDPAYLAVKAQMLKRLSDRMAFTIDPLPARLGEF